MTLTNHSIITLDGSNGEGGGQILRTALGLSALTGKPFSIEKIRANRSKPGLMRQHLTAVNAVTEICQAKTEGAAIGSASLTFIPGPVRAGDYHFSVGSAGSTTLVFQAILPALLTAAGPSTITLEGGTHNPFSPPLDFLSDAFVPVVNRMGPTVAIEQERYGFNPAGGGRWRATISPAPRLTPINLTERGEAGERSATALVASLPGEIAKRELARVGRRLGWDGDALRVRQLPGDQGPGNVLLLKIQSENVTEVFTGFGQKGTSAEAVADAAIDGARAYLLSSAPVGDHLADQLVVPFAIAGGGEFVATRSTPHLKTNVEMIERFLDVRISLAESDAGVRCTVRPR
ncbi:MAG: RNA 3'-terminal phosphate cyclase [Tepidisphaeraceae bacterium]